MQAEMRFTGNEMTFDERTLLVSKTDVRGVIRYANRDFFQIAKFSEEELVGKPHSLVRHPLMPRLVFQLLWETLSQQKEFFGFIVNQCKDGDYYWVFAHVTPDIDPNTGKAIGYHSSRKQPSRSALTQISKLYAALKDVEDRHHTKKEGIEAAREYLNDVLKQRNQSYEEFVFSIA